MSLPAGKVVEVFYDGECPLCMREIRMLMRRDRDHRIQFTDIAAPGFDPGGYGKDLDAFMARIHGRLPDGTWIEGVEVFRQLYAAIGFTWLAELSRFFVFSSLFDLGYRVFARNRLRLTGRCPPGGACALPADRASA